MNTKTRLLVALCATLAMVGVATAEVALTGAGATFPYPMYSKWFNEYGKIHKDTQINYQSIGSGGGIKQVTEGTVDFGASDGPMNDDQLKEFQAKRGSAVLHFPTVLGADVPSYNLPGVTAELKFTPEALAGIFLGKITKWNDPELVKANPGVKFPDQDLVVVHRSDGSGTTVNWPVGLGGTGNEGVSGQIKLTAYSVGYVELVYAIQNHLSYGQVKNSSGTFVKADLASVTAAAAGAAKDMPDDFRVSITNAPGKTAYPVSSFTWLLIPQKIADPAKKKTMTDFLKWMLTDGQNMTEALAYSRLPKEVQAKELKAISKIQ
jgi:phosphate transport system substrate-binding protein